MYNFNRTSNKLVLKYEKHPKIKITQIAEFYSFYWLHWLIGNDFQVNMCKVCPSFTNEPSYQ